MRTKFLVRTGRPLIVLSLIVLVLSVHALGSESPTLSLSKCIEQAMIANSDLKSAIWDLEIAKIDLQRAILDQRVNPNPATLRQRTLAVERAEKALADTKVRIGQEVEKRFFDLLKAQETVDLNQRRLAHSRGSYEIVKLKVDLGMESTAALMDAERSKLASEKALAAAESALRISKMNFLIYLGFDDPDKPFSISREDFTLPAMDYDEETSIAKALTNASRVKTAREQLEGAELDLKLAPIEFTAPLDRRKLEIAVERARLNHDLEMKRAIVQVRQYISDISSLENDLAQARLSLEVAKQQYEAAKLRYESGMITHLTLIQSENSLISSEHSFIDARFRLRDKVQEFANYLGL